MSIASNFGKRPYKKSRLDRRVDTGVQKEVTSPIQNLIHKVSKPLKKFERAKQYDWDINTSSEVVTEPPMMYAAKVGDQIVVGDDLYVVTDNGIMLMGGPALFNGKDDPLGALRDRINNFNLR